MKIIKQNYWWRISQSEIRNSAAAQKNWNRKTRAGKNSFPPTPFLFARTSNWILKFGIRIFVKKCSNFVQKTPPKCDFDFWRRGRDSNPRAVFTANTLAGCPIRPLWHLSIDEVILYKISLKVNHLSSNSYSPNFISSSFL